MVDAEEGQPKDPLKALEQTLSLIKAKDDTSRFAGLFLLRSLLDSNEKLRDDPEVVSKCWDAISSKFLIRLLKTEAKGKRSEEEAKSLVELAISIIRVFVNLLPPEELESEKIGDLCEPIAQDIPRLDSARRLTGFQILQSVAGRSANFVLFQNKNIIQPLAQLAKDDDLALREFGRLLMLLRNSGQDLSSLEFRGGFVDGILHGLIGQCTKDNRILLFEIITDIHRDSPAPYSLTTVQSLIPVIQESILTSPTTRTRKAVINLVGSIIRTPSLDNTIPTLLFTPSKELKQNPERPFTYLFPNFILIEIRATIPSLMEQLASPNYTTTALHLASCYDILSAFIIYLLSSMSAMETSEDSDNDATPLFLHPDLLLKLRSAITETLSLTLEFFRDRWDAAHAGAAGLSEQARRDLAVTGDWRQRPTSDQPLALTWDNPSITPERDPIILSGLRALALWLRDDDDDSTLMKEASGVLDVFLDLYKTGSGGGTEAEAEGGTDFRGPIAMLLASLLAASEKAVTAFLDLEGWAVLATDLKSCFKEEAKPEHMHDVIRALLAIVESSAVPGSREAWMDLVTFVAAQSVPVIKAAKKSGNKKQKLDSLQESEAAAGAAENLIAAYQLAVALVVKAPTRLKRNSKKDWERIKENAERISADDGKAGGVLSTETKEGLKEIVDGLKGVKV